MLGNPKTCTQRSLNKITQLQRPLLSRLHPRYCPKYLQTAPQSLQSHQCLRNGYLFLAPSITMLGPKREKELSIAGVTYRRVLLQEFLPLSRGSKSTFPQVITSSSQTGTTRNYFSGEINILLLWDNCKFHVPENCFLETHSYSSASPTRLFPGIGE